MKRKDRTVRSRPRTRLSIAPLWLAALFAPPLITAVHAQHGPATAQHGSVTVSGTWHVAILGWGIEDHLLVVREQDGAVTGKFEFADVSGSIAAGRLRFEVRDPSGGKLLLSFEGALSGDNMQGLVTSPKDGPMVQHGLANRLTTEWTAARETSSH
ncbi:MAG TPA: hypothetical protein VE907_07625 [Gammaproteobacteria bacterium]|nr:hypothetical protein [Gammaproteobacteria bacterium]